MRSKVTCSEGYLGSGNDANRIVDALLARRQQALTPVYMASHLRNVTRVETPSQTRFQLLSELLANRNVDCFDYAFFEHAVNAAEAHLRKRFPRFLSLPWQSYVVADSISDSGSCGGFYSRFGIGFQYESNFGFSEMLNAARIPDGKVRAYELARNYIHDSFHAATYRSFSWHNGKAFRYQYGINFRLPNGISYSSARSDSALPFTINLNVLMDGITALATADAMRSIRLDIRTPDNYAKNLINDVRCEFDNVSDEDMLHFADTVVRPTERFLGYWGGRDFFGVVGQAMLDGTLAPLRTHFEAACVERSSDPALSAYLGTRRRAHAFLGCSIWEDLFLSADFRRDLCASSQFNGLAVLCGLDIQ